MNLKYIILLVVLLVAGAYLGICIYIASVLTKPAPTPLKTDKKVIGDRVSDVVFRATDNVQLAGWFYQGTNEKVIMFVHGAGDQNRANEVYGTPEIAKYFYDLGYSILLFDLRGTGESEKTRSSFGQYEANDVAGAYNYLVKQEYKPESIGIVSDSLGAISTIMAADSVKGAGAIVLDSPAKEVKEIISNVMVKDKSVPRFLHPGIFISAKYIYKIDVEQARPITKIEVLDKTPLLFLHGGADTLINPKDSEEMAAMVNNAKRIEFPEIKHVEIYKKDPVGYLRAVEEFFNDNLK